MRKYTFSALITPGLAARDAAPGYRYRTSIRCVVQPRDREYFPAVISLDEQPAAGPRVRAVVSVVLAGHEAAAFFAPGQHFTIWADAIVGHAIRGHGLAGYGVICGAGITVTAQRQPEQALPADNRRAHTRLSNDARTMANRRIGVGRGSSPRR